MRHGAVRLPRIFGGVRAVRRALCGVRLPVIIGMNGVEAAPRYPPTEYTGVPNASPRAMRQHSNA